VLTGLRQLLAALATGHAGSDVRRDRLVEFAPGAGDLVMRTTLSADAANPGLPLVILPPTDLANTLLPEVVGRSVQPAATTAAVFPVMIPIARLVASFTAAARPFVSE